MTRSLAEMAEAFKAFDLTIAFALPSLRAFAELFGDPEEFAKKLAIEECGVTEVDIRRVDLDRWQVRLWNGRRIDLP